MTLMSSNQIAGMMSAQQAMFGNFASYATQITPPYANMGGQPGLGVQPGGTGMPGAAPPPSYSAMVGMGPAPAPPPMMQTGAWHPAAMQQGMGATMVGMGQMMGTPGSGAPAAFGEQMVGGGLRAAQAGISGLSAVNTAAGAAAMFGIGGAGMAALGGLPVAGAVMAGGYAIDQMAGGMQQRMGVNRVLRNRFGGQMGIGDGDGGRGFSDREMGQVSTMIREMGSSDMFTNVDELTRIMDKTAQMGLYRGVQGAENFRKKFKELTSGLKQMAKTMNSTLEEAADFFAQGRSMGFFTGKEINANMMNVVHGASATGMSTQQVLRMQQTGTQMGRALGMRGKTGARAMREMGLNIATMQNMGVLSDEMVAEATGGLEGAEGAQALGQRMMEVNARFMKRGAGRVMLAAMWNKQGGIDRNVLRRVQRGELNFAQLRQMGRRNIAQTGGRRSEFFSQMERIAGEAQAAGGGTLMLGALEEHFSRRGGVTLDDPIMQRRMRRMLGVSQSELEAMIQAQRNMPMAMAERRSKMRQSMEQAARAQSREGKGVQGMKRELSRWWEQKVENRLKQPIDDLMTSVNEAISGLVSDAEGVVKMQMSAQAEEAYKELMGFGEITGQRKGRLLMGKDFSSLRGQAMAAGRGGGSGSTSFVGRSLDAMGAGKFAKGLGMIMGTRPTESTIGTAIRLGMIGKDAEGKVRYRTRTQEGKYKFGGLVAGQDEVISKVRDFQRSAAMGYGELGFSTQAIQRMAASTRIAVTKEYGAEPEKWAAIKEASKGNAQTALWRRIKELRKSDAEIDEAFSKFEGDQGRQFALLRELERESGISGTTLRSDVSGAIGFEAGFSELETTLEGMEKMEADAFRALSKAEIDEGTDFKFGVDRSYKKGGAPGRMRRGGKARPGEGGGKAWGGHSVADLGRTKVLGVATAEVDAETMKQLWSNSQIKDEMMKWRFGSGDEKAKAMSNLLMWANTDPNERGDGAPTISESQRNALRGLSTVMQKGSKDAEFAIGRLARIDAGKATMAIKRRERELGTELKDRLSTAETEARFAAAEGGMGVLEKLRQIQDIRISGGEGSLKRTAEMERNLLMSLANASPDVMEAIQNTPGAEYLSQGLTYGRQLAEHLSRKKGVGRTQALIQKTLGVYGLGELGGKIGQEKMKEISRLVEAGDREKALQLMETAAGEAGGAVKDLFTQRKGLVERMMKVGEAGVTDEEAKEAGVGLAGTSLGGLRVKGAKQEVMATSELQAKILKQMETSVNIEKAMLLKQVSADDFEKFIKKTKVLDEPGGEE